MLQSMESQRVGHDWATEQQGFLNLITIDNLGWLFFVVGSTLCIVGCLTAFLALPLDASNIPLLPQW